MKLILDIKMAELRFGYDITEKLYEECTDLIDFAEEEVLEDLDKNFEGHSLEELNEYLYKASREEEEE